eukprot:4154737-Prymnesium_polylepis.1
MQKPKPGSPAAANVFLHATCMLLARGGASTVGFFACTESHITRVALCRLCRVVCGARARDSVDCTRTRSLSVRGRALCACKCVHGRTAIACCPHRFVCLRVWVGNARRGDWCNVMWVSSCAELAASCETTLVLCGRLLEDEVLGRRRRRVLPVSFIDKAVFFLMERDPHLHVHLELTEPISS